MGVYNIYRIKNPNKGIISLWIKNAINVRSAEKLRNAPPKSSESS